MSHIVVKRSGGDEAFDTKKVYASIYASMLAAHETVKTAEYVASEVSCHIEAWVHKVGGDVSARDIRVEAGRHLLEYNHRAQFLYVHHKIMF
jgi:hypothetical protein